MTLTLICISFLLANGSFDFSKAAIPFNIFEWCVDVDHCDGEPSLWQIPVVRLLDRKSDATVLHQSSVHSDSDVTAIASAYGRRCHKS